MNERIKELATEVGISVDYLTNTKQIVLLEKFAELIVRECIATIQMGITRDGHQTEKYIRSMEHINDIKNHFGVER